MDLCFSEEQTMIREIARDFLADYRARRVKLDADGRKTLWQQMAELGWQGLVIPNEFGGSGLPFLFLCILIEEQGSLPLASPFLVTTACGALPLVHFGSDDLKKHLLPRIAAGESTATYAVSEAADPWATTRFECLAQQHGEHYELQGEKLFVPYAEQANYLLVAARLQDNGNTETGILLVDRTTPGIEVTPIETLGPESRYRVKFEKVHVPMEHRIGTPGTDLSVIDRINQWGTVARCAEMVGGAQQVLDMSVDYACERQAFGRSIGTFQAIQHHCADMGVDVLSARLMMQEAAWALDTNQDDAALRASAAKAWISDAYRRVCALGHQIHGAMGFAGEHALPDYYRHAVQTELAFGDATWHRQQISEALGL